ncbi:MAG: VOC family protein [Chromatiaceae bacterium]|nr:VOC family protein [Chromatiaceae bacterium]
MSTAHPGPQIRLGHIVLYVRELHRSLGFYRDALGLAVTTRLFNDRAAMLSGGDTHHELMLIEVGDAPAPPQGRRLGLYHVAWKVGNDLAALRDAYHQLQAAGVTVHGMADHTISQSLYMYDPDGNEVEVYVDDPTVDWRNDTSWSQAPVKPLRLD